MYKFSFSIAEKLINFISANYPNYLAEHPRFTVINVGGDIYSYLIRFSIVVLIPLVIYIVYRLYDIRYNHTRYISCIDSVNNKNRYLTKKDHFFTKKSIIVFTLLFIWISVPFALQLVSGYRNHEFKDGFTLDELAYSPGNQPITDEIVQAMNENVIPEVIKTGEAIAETTTDPELASELIEEVTGVDTNAITGK